MNFIVICLDSLRRDHLGCYGNDWIRTPHLDKFAADNIVFDNMYPNGIPTLPFRRGVMQGKRVHPFRDNVPLHPNNVHTLLGWHGLPFEYPTLQEVLQQNEYVTGMITDVFHFFPPDMNFHIGFDSFIFIRGNEGDRLHMGGTRRKDFSEFLYPELEGTAQQKYLEQHMRNQDGFRSEEDYFSAQVFRTAEKWLERNARYYENFYLYIDSFDPHEPWDPPRDYREMYDPGYDGRDLILPQQGKLEGITEAELKHIKALYAGEVSMVDRWFGHFMEKFYNMGLDQDTAVVVVSDHGHPLGEHGLIRKTPPALRWNLLDTVMLMSLPKKKFSGKRIESIVHEYDIAPTLLSLTGIEKPGSMNGLDFSGLLDGTTEKIRDYAAGGYNDHTYIRTPEYYYLVNLQDKEQKYLFDLKKDPEMLNDISGQASDVVREMEQMVEKELDGWKLPEKVGQSGYHKPMTPYKIRKRPYTSVF